MADVKLVQMLRSFLRGDTPKKRGDEEQAKKIEEALYAVENDKTAELNQLLSTEQLDVNWYDQRRAVLY